MVSISRNQSGHTISIFDKPSSKSRFHCTSLRLIRNNSTSATMVLNFFKSDKTVTPFNKQSAPLSPDTVLVRQNKHVPDFSKDDEGGESATYGRTNLYEAKLVVTPVKVPARPSTSTEKLNTQRLLVTNEEVEGLSTLFGKLLSAGFPSSSASSKKEEEKKNDDDEDGYMPTHVRSNGTTTKVCSTSSLDESYGRRKQTIRVKDNREVTVTRSCRLANTH